MEIIITNHGLIRWNQRVKQSTSKYAIKKYLSKCYINDSIELYYKDFYLIDNDIIARLQVIEEDEKIIKIKLITTFGRISENPALNNLPEAIKLKHKYGKMFYERKI